MFTALPLENLYSHPMLSFTIFSLLLSFLFIIKRYSNSTKNSPPSPPKLPILGNLHQLGLFPHRPLQSLANKYGPLMLIHFGKVPVLVVSSSDAARQIMKTHDLVFSDRPPRKIFDILLYGSKDVASTAYGEYWRQTRSLAVLHLLSNKRVQSYRYVREEEAARMIQHIIDQSSCDPPLAVNLSELCSTVTNDITCRIALGRKYREEGEEGKKFEQLMLEFGKLLGTFRIGDYVPCLDWLSKVDGFYAMAERVARQLDVFIDKVIEEHITRRSRSDGFLGEDQYDFVDVLLSVQESNDIGFQIDRTAIKGLIVVQTSSYFSTGTRNPFFLARNPYFLAGPNVVVFLHGFPEIWYSWRHQMIALADAGFRAIVPDFRGCRLFDPPTEPKTKKATFFDSLLNELYWNVH